MNKITSLPYLDRLDSERRIVFKKLAPFKNRYALAGGTAIMLQIGHRQSYDFDCFSSNLPEQKTVTTVKRIFSVTGKPTIATPEMITFTLPKKIDVTFVWDPYSPLRQPLPTESIPLYHLDDLAANKARTIGRRAAWRDYVDMFFLFKWNYFTLKQIISLSDKKFGDDFSQKLFLQQLTYYDDIEVDKNIVFLKESYTPKQIKEYLKKTVRAYLQSILPIS
jgi:hypothetical protein